MILFCSCFAFAKVGSGCFHFVSPCARTAVSVCLSAEYLRKLSTNIHEIFEGGTCDWKQVGLISFWW